MTTEAPSATRGSPRIRTSVLLGVLGAIYVVGAVVPAVRAMIPEADIVLPAPRVAVVEHALWPAPEARGRTEVDGVVLIDVTLETAPTTSELYLVTVTVLDEAGSVVSEHEDAFTMRSAQERRALLVRGAASSVDLADSSVDPAGWTVTVTPTEGVATSSALAPEVTLTDASVYDGDGDWLGYRATAVIGPTLGTPRDEDMGGFARMLVTRDVGGNLNGAALVMLDLSTGDRAEPINGPMFVTRTTDASDFARVELY